MKQEVNPVVMWAILAVILLVVVFVGFRYLNPNQTVQTTGSEDAMKKVKETGTFYTPPIPIGRGGAAGAGGNSFTPPSR